MHSKVENVVMNGSTVGELRKVGKEQHLKSTVMNGVRSERGDVVKSVVMRRKLLRNMESLQRTRSGLTQTKRSRESQCKSDYECAREFKSDDRPDLYAGTPPLEAYVFNHAHRRVTCILPREGNGGKGAHRGGQSSWEEGNGKSGGEERERKVARATAERVVLVAKQDTLQRGAKKGGISNLYAVDGEESDNI